MKFPLSLLFLAFCSLSLSAKVPDYPKGAVPVTMGAPRSDLPPVNGLIRIDQFGYLPDSRKVAVLAVPRKGFNAFLEYSPGTDLELRRASDSFVVFKGSATPWNHGGVDASSGDSGLWFDFSAFHEQGAFYIFDPKNGQRSHVFNIGPDVYSKVLRAAVRVFYHQRENFDHPSRFAEGPWVDAPSFTQDVHTRAVWAKNDPSLERDMSGGWMDAGDQNKYITFLSEVIHPLLYAYRLNSGAFGDDFGIPESGNGLPDLLDEVKFELDWMRKMQDADGGVFIKMGEIQYGGGFPPSSIKTQRYYGPKSSAATIAYAGVMAHAARVYENFPVWREYARDLGRCAEVAYAWYKSNPRTEDVDTGEIKSGDADRDFTVQDYADAVASVHLFALTGKQAYNDSFRTHYTSFRQMTESGWSPYDAGQAEALLDYVCLKSADPKVVATIKNRLKVAFGDPLLAPKEEDSFYRAYMPATCFHWGSNLIAASAGKNAASVIDYGLAEGNEAVLGARAADVLHYLHGVNPLGMVYLTNMGALGAGQSATRLYHAWFGVGTPFSDNPPPGYVVGGPNQSYGGGANDAAYAWIANQPRAKAYADVNEGYPVNSWELSEPGIYYQAMYVRLLANYVGKRPVVTKN